MNGLLMLSAALGLGVWALWVDTRLRPYASPVLWLPTVWLAIISSRPPGSWLYVATGLGFGSIDVEGNPINSLVYFGLMAAALVALGRRALSWRELIIRNWPLILLYLYYLLSAAWSPFPLASFKRLINNSACVLMALVILSEVNPAEAVRLVFVRVAFLLLPLSLVLAKYFPSIGRGRSGTFEVMYCGACFHKNSLGLLLIVSIIMFVWDWIELRRQGPSRERKARVRVLQVMLGISAILLLMAHCATAYLCLIVISLGVVICGWLVRRANGKKLLIVGMAAVAALLLLDGTLGISTVVAGALGRKANFTGRTEIWQGVLDRHTNPVIGCGFYSFWNTSMASDFYEDASFVHVKTAHNGYVETYLDGGFVAVGLLVIWLLIAGRNVTNKLFSGGSFGRVAFLVWLISVIYNAVESDYFRLEPLWFGLLLFGIDYPIRNARSDVGGHESKLSGGLDEQSASTVLADEVHLQSRIGPQSSVGAGGNA